MVIVTQSVEPCPVLSVMHTHSYPKVGLLSLELRATGLKRHGSRVLTE